MEEADEEIRECVQIRNENRATEEAMWLDPAPHSEDFDGEYQHLVLQDSVEQQDRTLQNKVAVCHCETYQQTKYMKQFLESYYKHRLKILYCCAQKVLRRGNIAKSLCNGCHLTSRSDSLEKMLAHFNVCFMTRGVPHSGSRSEKNCVFAR